MTVRIHGCSDDNIELDGGIHDDLGGYDGAHYLQFSEGTVIKIEYGGDGTGCWRASVHKAGAGTVEVLQTGVDDDSEEPAPTALKGTVTYSDVLSLAHSEDFTLLCCVTDESELPDTSNVAGMRATAIAGDVLAALDDWIDDDDDRSLALRTIAAVIKKALGTPETS